ncbi:MAG: helix-turn-helix domain-containing protein, partial [Planctomycetota bacterium]
MSASTEERLLDAALTLFAERGYEATSVRAILDEVGVTAPVLYHHFGSKEQLFERLVRWKHEDALAELEGIVASPRSAVERLRAILR